MLNISSHGIGSVACIASSGGEAVTTGRGVGEGGHSNGNKQEDIKIMDILIYYILTYAKPLLTITQPHTHLKRIHLRRPPSSLGEATQRDPGLPGNTVTL